MRGQMESGGTYEHDNLIGANERATGDSGEPARAVSRDSSVRQLDSL
jgi:hypothetical protein